MNKKGFVFIETVVVLVVVMVIIVGIYSSYSIINRNASKRDKYDNINDIYKVSMIMSLMTSENIGASYVVVDSTNCGTYMNSDCASIITNLNIKNIIINSDNIDTILLTNPTNLSNEEKEYMDTLNSTKKYMIISVEREEKYYYSSLELSVGTVFKWFNQPGDLL